MNPITPNPRTVQQNRHIYWLFGQLGISKDAIAEIVWDHTNHRTHHTSELQFMEAMSLIKSLESLRKKPRKTVAERIEDLPPTPSKGGGDVAHPEGWGDVAHPEGVGDEYVPSPEWVELDRKRKGLIKAIYSWFELQGKVPTMNYVKGVACRAAGVNSFNNISPSALTRLYAEFCRKQKAVEAMKVDDFSVCLN